MRKARLRWVKLILIIGVLGAGIGVFLMFGPPQLMARTETPDFCASCHVMESQYESWFHEGAHRSIKCVDCHLPHQNVATHYVWKTIDGMKDVMLFYSGRVPERIVLSEHGQGVMQANCIRCHETIVSRIDYERQCWGCHRRLSHVRSGALLTIDEL
jgi:cytochrome c nitrite reductase small subunit